jgi:hypothetical protein
MMDKRRSDHNGPLPVGRGFEVKQEAPMITPHLRRVVLVIALASAGIAAVAGAAVARTVFDGTWSVLIVTDSGDCDRAYRYGIEISNGNVIYDGGGSINLKGRVAPNGTVRVSVSAGSQRADGSGRLSRDRGGGVWRGRGSTGSCAGTWEAERRG